MRRHKRALLMPWAGGANPLVYTNKIIALGPIGYWTQADLSGTTSVDSSGNSFNGTYTNVTLAQAGIGDGRTSALYVPGSNSKDNIYGAGLAAAFNGGIGTAMVWAKVSAAGVWTDGALRVCNVFFVNSSNRLYLRKPTASNTLTWLYTAGGTTKTFDQGSTSPLGWFHMAITWADAANGDSVKFYYNGAQISTTQTGNGTFTGALNSSFVLVGAGDTSPANIWDGYLAHAAVFTRVLSGAEIASAATVP